MDLIHKSLRVIEHDDLDSLPTTADTIIGTIARHVEEDTYTRWDGTEWVPFAHIESSLPNRVLDYLEIAETPDGRSLREFAEVVPIGYTIATVHYYKDYTGGGNIFKLKSFTPGTYVDDGGYTIIADNGFVWIAVRTNTVKVKQYGAIGNLGNYNKDTGFASIINSGVTAAHDDTQCVKNAWDFYVNINARISGAYASRPVFLFESSEYGSYYLTEAHVFTMERSPRGSVYSIDIQGDGLGTMITYANDDQTHTVTSSQEMMNGTLVDKYEPEYDNMLIYDVNNYQDFSLSNITIIGATDKEGLYSWRSSGHSQNMNLENLRVTGFRRGIWIYGTGNADKISARNLRWDYGGDGTNAAIFADFGNIESVAHTWTGCNIGSTGAVFYNRSGLSGAVYGGSFVIHGGGTLFKGISGSKTSASSFYTFDFIGVRVEVHDAARLITLSSGKINFIGGSSNTVQTGKANIYQYGRGCSIKFTNTIVDGMAFVSGRMFEHRPSALILNYTNTVLKRELPLAVVPMLQGAEEANTKTDTLYITSPLDVCMDYKLRLVVNNTITVDILIPFDEVEYTSTESGSKAYHDEIYENLLNRVADEINASSISSYVSAVVEEMDLLGGEILDAGNSVVDTQYKETVLAIKNLNFGTTTLRASDDHNTENFVASERLSKLSYHVTRPNNLGKSAIISAYQCVLFDLTGSLAQADCNLWGMPKAAASPKMNTLTAVNQHGTILHYNGSKYPYEVPNKTFVAHLNIYTRPVVLAGAMENDYHIRISNMKGSFAVDFVLTWAEASAGVHKKIIIGEQLRTLEHNERVITLNVTDPEDHNAGISGDAYIVYY